MTIKWLPNILTSMNIACGATSLLFLINNEVKFALIFFVISMFLDVMDGKTARYFNISSEFGRELDSLADLVSFGVVPAVFLYQSLNLQSLTIINALVVAAFIVCGALRLAKYNTLNIKDHFLGMPIPIAGGLLVMSCLIFDDKIFLLTISSILSSLMVSNIKFMRI